VHSLEVDNSDPIQEPFKLSRPGPVLGHVGTWPLYVCHRAVWLPLLVVAFGGAGSIRLTQLLILLGVSVSVVEGRSSARAHLLAMASISSDIMWFFMVSLRIRDESLSAFLKNMMMDLSSTSRMIFHLLQKHWMNSWVDSPFFSTTLARSQSTPSRSQVARKTLMNYRYSSDHERTDPMGCLMSHVLAEDNR
jgi:hypothetical protein